MKIKRPDTKRVKLGDIMPGDVFEYPSKGLLYMVLDQVRAKDGSVDCVCLSDGQVVSFLSIELVRPINATVCVDND